MSDNSALEDFPELVAVLPDAELRSIILAQVSLVMDRLEGKNNNNNNKIRQIQNKIDPKLLLKDEDLTETFVRGSGPGGQKINKTSNRVVLVHEPTQLKLKVECQDTRSLQQNLKIARKRLLEKVDEHWNLEWKSIQIN
jgi:protein subunit release factor B